MGVAELVDCAFTCTPFAWRSRVSGALSQKVGTCVENRSVSGAWRSPTGYRTFVVNVP